MTTDRDAEEALDAVTEGLEGAVRTTDRLTGQIDDMDRHIAKLSRGIDRGLRQSIEGLAFDGQTLSSVLKDLANSVVRSTYNAGVSPVTRHLSGLIAGQIENFIHGASPFAAGGAFSQGRVIPFAKGGVVDGPTTFGMRGATGLMGEAGPEAIMPLARGADGRLGVRSSGGGQTVNVTFNISTPDVEGFGRSQTQIAAQMSRIMGRAARNR